MTKRLSKTEKQVFNMVKEGLRPEDMTEINPFTLRQALGTLTRMGVIERNGAQGTYTYSLPGEGTVKLTTIQVKTYEGIKRGLTPYEISQRESIEYNTVYSSIDSLTRRGLIKKVGRKGYVPTGKEVKILIKDPAKSMKSKFGILKYLFRQYGADNIRYIWYQKDVADIERIKKKTKIREATLIEIMNRLENLAS